MTYANKKAILKFGVIMILGVVVASAAMSTGVLADAPAESEYSNILSNTAGDGTSSNPHVVTTLDELQAVKGDLSAHYVLGNDINASETSTWNSGAGFKPIGNYTEDFTGNFDGQGYTVDGLYINRPNSNDVGLFGGASSDIKNIGVTNIDIQGDSSVGGIVGNNLGSTITNSFSSGAVSGNMNVGGLVGYNQGSSNITKSYSNSNVTGDGYVGGLVGENKRSSNITKSYSVGIVTGNTDVGGLIGNNSATVTDSYWNTETSTQSTSGGSETGLTTAEMTGSAAETNMVDFDFTGIWSTVLASDIDSSADSYPIIQSNDRKAQLVSADVYEAPTYYTVDVSAVDSEGNAIDNATITIDGIETSTSDLTDGEYNISADATGYDLVSDTVVVNGSSESISLTLSETEYAVDIVVEDGDGNVVDSANVTFDGVDGLTHNVKDGDYELNVTADNYVDTTQNVTVDGADKTVTVTLLESTYTVDVSAVDSEGNAIDNATITIDGTETSTSDLADGEYNISADATGYDLVSDTVVVDGSSESISLTLSETEYVVDIVVEDGDGNVVDSANVTFDGVDGLTHNVKDGDYELNVTSDNYVDTSQNVTVDGADETFTVTLSEEEEAVIVSDSGSEESGGMSTLVSASIVAFFGIFIMVVLLFVKD